MVRGSENKSIKNAPALTIDGEGNVIKAAGDFASDYKKFKAARNVSSKGAGKVSSKGANKVSSKVSSKGKREKVSRGVRGARAGIRPTPTLRGEDLHGRGGICAASSWSRGHLAQTIRYIERIAVQSADCGAMPVSELVNEEYAWLPEVKDEYPILDEWVTLPKDGVETLPKDDVERFQWYKISVPELDEKIMARPGLYVTKYEEKAYRCVVAVVPSVDKDDEGKDVLHRYTAYFDRTGQIRSWTKDVIVCDTDPYFEETYSTNEGLEPSMIDVRLFTIMCNKVDELARAGFDCESDEECPSDVEERPSDDDGMTTDQYALSHLQRMVMVKQEKEGAWYEDTDGTVYFVRNRDRNQGK